MTGEQTINGLTKEWKVLTFGEIIDFLTDYQANGSFAGLKENVRYYSDKNFAVLVRLKDLRQELQNSNEFVYTDEQGYNFLKKSRVKEGDILVANVGAGVGTTLKMPKFDGNATLGPNMFRVDLKSNVLPKFFLAFSNSMNYWHQLNLVSAGSGQPKINKAQYRSIKIPIPPVETQQQIVSKIEELFSELDKGSEELKTAQQQLKVYRQAVLKWAFEGKLTNEDVKDGELPYRWVNVTLGDVCTSVEYGSATKSKATGKVPVLRMGNIQNGIFDWGDLVYTDDEEEINKYLLKKNDVLFNRTNSAELVGKTAIYKGERPAIFAGYLIRINRIEDKIDASYLTYYLNSQKAKSYGNSVRSFGVNQSNINGTKLKTYPLPLPPLEEQQQIVQEIESRLSVCDKIEETIIDSLKQAEALRQSILKKAFDGKL